MNNKIDPNSDETATSVVEDEQREDRGQMIDDLADQNEAASDEALLPAYKDSRNPSPPPGDDLAHVHPFVGTVDTTPQSAKTVTQIEVPFRTILRVIATLVVVWLLLQIGSILIQGLLAFMLATALVPLARRLQDRGLSAGLSALVVFLSLIGFVAFLGWLVVPRFVEQVQSTISNWDDLQTNFENSLRSHPMLERQYQRMVGQNIDVSRIVSSSEAVQAGTGVLTGIANLIFILSMTIYLMIEGNSTWRFFARYFTPQLRYRVRRSYPEITRVMSGYVIGQVITSVCFGVFAYVLTWSLDVPQPMLLAVLAALLDAVPIVGAITATIPAVLMAFTVSPNAALIVLIAYLAYQQFENYVLAPRVFGNTMQVSALACLAGVLIGAKLMGVTGALIALPITACFPALERVWTDPLPTQVQLAEQQEREAAERAAREATQLSGSRRRLF